MSKVLLAVFAALAVVLWAAESTEKEWRSR